MSKNKLLVESQYWGCVDFYRYSKDFNEIVFEKHEHFVKASYRNRCEIATPDGVLKLSVPIKNGRNKKQIVSDTEIFYVENWQKQHWDSLCSAYRSSPYFEYYEDDLQPLYEKKFKYLLDLNEATFNWAKERLDFSMKHSYSEKFSKVPTEDYTDFRSFILPKAEKSKNPFKNNPVKYIQVFGERTGFFPNLCILDLLFAEGPNAANLLGME